MVTTFNTGQRRTHKMGRKQQKIIIPVTTFDTGQRRTHKTQSTHLRCVLLQVLQLGTDSVRLLLEGGRRPRSCRQERQLLLELPDGRRGETKPRGIPGTGGTGERSGVLHVRSVSLAMRQSSRAGYRTLEYFACHASMHVTALFTPPALSFSMSASCG